MKLLMLSIVVVGSSQSQLTEPDERLQMMLQSLGLQPPPGVEMMDERMKQRMDPLLRVLMVSALQRSRDQGDKNNLSPPRYKQDPLLRQLRQNVVENFADMILELPSRTQAVLSTTIGRCPHSVPGASNPMP